MWLEGLILFSPYFSLKVQTVGTVSTFQKLFQGNIFFYLLNIIVTAAPTREQKKFKNYISILAIVNYHNWLNALPPSNEVQVRVNKLGSNFSQIITRSKVLICLIVSQNY